MDNSFKEVITLFSLFKKKPKALTIGNQTIHQSPFLAIVIPSKQPFQRDQFLSDFTNEVFQHGLSRHRTASHVRYWYDGPIGNQGLLLWEDGAYQRVKNSVVGISRLDMVRGDILKIAQEAVQILLDNKNIVLLLPHHNAIDEHVSFYQKLFPDAVFLHL